MRATRASARAAALLIVTALPACDNVQWGGVDVQTIPPPPAAGTERAAPDAETFLDLGLPTGTVLFHVIREPGGATIVPVAEVSGDSLRTLRRPAEVAPEAYRTRFRDAVLEDGAQFQLFRRGAEVGILTVQEGAAPTACGVPTARGNIVTVAAAADVGEFLAFRRGLAPEVMGEYAPPQVTGSIRTYASIVAERVIVQAGLQRPRSWPGAQRDLQPVEISRGGNPEMAATYLVGDRLEVGPADRQGYAVFYLADYDRRTGYSPLYSEAHRYADGGKAAPRLIDYLDWHPAEAEGGEEAAGGPEVLVRVFGDDASWYEAISGDGGRWRKVWEGPRCGGPPRSLAADTAAADTARSGRSR